MMKMPMETRDPETNVVFARKNCWMDSSQPVRRIDRPDDVRSYVTTVSDIEDEELGPDTE